MESPPRQPHPERIGDDDLVGPRSGHDSRRCPHGETADDVHKSRYEPGLAVKTLQAGSCKSSDSRSVRALTGSSRRLADDALHQLTVEMAVMSNLMKLKNLSKQILVERRADAEVKRMRVRVSRRRSDPALWLSVCVALPYIFMLLYFARQIAYAVGVIS